MVDAEISALRPSVQSSGCKKNGASKWHRLLPEHLAASDGIGRGRIDDETILELESRPEVRTFSSLEKVDDRGMAGRAVAAQQRLATMAVILRALEEGAATR